MWCSCDVILWRFRISNLLDVVRSASVNLLPRSIHEQNSLRNCSGNMLCDSNVRCDFILFRFSYFPFVSCNEFHILHPAKSQCFDLRLWSEVFMNNSNCTVYCTAWFTNANAVQWSTAIFIKYSCWGNKSFVIGNVHFYTFLGSWSHRLQYLSVSAPYITYFFLAYSVQCTMNCLSWSGFWFS